MKTGSGRNKVIRLKSTHNTRRRLNTSKPIVVLTVLAAIGLGVFLGFRPNAYQVTIQGKAIGAIKDAKILEDAKQTVITQLEVLYHTEVEFEEEVQLTRYRAKKRDYIDPGYLATYMRKNMEVLIAFREIYVEGKSIGIVASDNDVEEIKALLKTKYYGNQDIKVDFGKKVEIKEIFAKEDQLINHDLIVEKCMATTPKIVEHEVKSGDSLWKIADGLGTSPENIMQETPGLAENNVLRIGDIVKARINEPLLPLVIIKDDAIAEEEKKEE